MRYLLDTHCWLWMQTEPERLAAKGRRLLQDPETDVLFSAATAWEIAIKFALGKLRLPAPPVAFVARALAEDRLATLPISHDHALRAGELPAHHRDPFDRLLIAQAQIEGLTLLTADRRFAQYDVTVLWV